MSSDEGNLQNEFFNRARKERASCELVLANGSKLVGRVQAFDKFTVLIDTGRGEHLVFKHAIATVGASGSGPVAK